MFAYDPVTTLRRVSAPIVAIRRRTPGVTGDDRDPQAVVAVDLVDLDAPGHNLLRYRPDEVTAAILRVTEAAGGD
jgi:hypothetical protein